jgi:outer membrane protein
MYKYFFVGLSFLSVLILVAYIFFGRPHQRIAYVLNQKLFEGFAGKVELANKLQLLRAENKKVMDSIQMLMHAKANEPALIQLYSETMSNYEVEEKQISDTYTAEIWKRLNQYISDFGKENEYDFIFGAVGDGNLMYAKDSNDVTAELIKYVNSKYQHGD